MTKVFEKVQSETSENVLNNLEIGVYSIYDCVLKQFGAPISIPVSKVNDYFNMLVNDVASPYYNHENDYILNKIAKFDSEKGEIQPHFIQRICVLDSFIDYKRRNLQTLLQTLNYLPTGYFKMPAEQKQAIQAQIDSAVQKYVQDYVVPDMDVNAEKIKDLESIIDDYKQRLEVVNK